MFFLIIFVLYLYIGARPESKLDKANTKGVSGKLSHVKSH